MIITIQCGDQTEMPEFCPFSHHDRERHICAHPVRVLMTKSLPCNYINMPDQYEPCPKCCPLIRDPIDNIRVDMMP